jgi:heme A synthase
MQSIFGAVLRHTGERLDAHLLFAGLVALHIVFVLLRVTKSHPDRPGFIQPSLALGILLLLQFVLGAGSYFGKFTPMLEITGGALALLTTAHLITGALMLAMSLLLTLRAYRYSAASSQFGLAEKVLTERFSG